MATTRGNVILSADQWEDYKKDTLKLMAVRRGLDASGTKAELVDRLIEAEGPIETGSGEEE